MAKAATYRSAQLYPRSCGIPSATGMGLVVHCLSAGLVVSDWNSKLEETNGDIAQLHVKISFQGEIVQQLIAMRRDTAIANRILEIRRESLTRALAHKEFIVSKIGKNEQANLGFSSASESSRGARITKGTEPLRFRWDQVRQ
jgi:hypothetical protein